MMIFLRFIHWSKIGEVGLLLAHTDMIFRQNAVKISWYLKELACQNVILVRCIKL